MKPSSSANGPDPIIDKKFLLEYDLHGKPLLAIANEKRGTKYLIINENGEELSLNENRLHIYQYENSHLTPTDLSNLSKSLNTLANSYPIEALWESLKTKAEFTLDEVFQLTEKEDSLENKASLRRSLLIHNLYFKRSEKGFRPRTQEEVDHGKLADKERMQAETNKLSLQLALQKRLSGNTKAPLPPSINCLEEIAALGKKSHHTKTYSDLIENIIAKYPPKSHLKYIEQKAFYILREIEHFSENQNLSPIRLGRPVAFDSQERTEAEQLFRESKTITSDNRLDLSHLFTVTIDSEDTQDFDDALSLEEIDGEQYLWVHIADSSSHIKGNSTLFNTLIRRATSIYCPDETIPMLPPSLSEGVLSLKEGLKRFAISFKFRLVDLVPSPVSIHLSTIKVSKRYSYDDVDSILCDQLDHPHFSLFHTLWDVSSNRELFRLENGAILFNRRDLAPSINKNQKIKLVVNSDDTPARKLVSEMMILTNEYAGTFATQNNLPFVYRSQEAPDIDIETYSAGVPDGPAREFARRGLLKKSNISLQANKHAGLGLATYCQVTSPIRRAMDHILINQLRGYLEDGRTSYSSDDLSSLLQQLQLGADEAQIIQRERGRYWLLKYMEQEKFKSFSGTIIRVDGARPLIELDDLYCIFTFNPATEVNSTRLGEKIKVTITKLDPQNEKLYLSEDVESK